MHRSDLFISLCARHCTNPYNHLGGPVPPARNGENHLVMTKASSHRKWKFLLVSKDPSVVDVLYFSDFLSKRSFADLDTICTEHHGTLTPPLEYLSSGTKVREWRGLDNTH